MRCAAIPVEAAEAGDAVDQVEHEAAGNVVVAGDEHVARELAVEIAERRRGDVLERGHHFGAGRGAWIASAIDPSGGTTQRNSRPRFSSPLAIETTTLPSRRSAS